MFVHHPQRDNSVAQTKIVVWILYGLGIPIYAYAMLLNITTWKSDILFVVALILGGIKAYHDVLENRRKERRSILDNRKAELENRLKEIDILEREKALDGHAFTKRPST